jgi:hypothetical protein
VRGFDLWGYYETPGVHLIGQRAAAAWPLAARAQVRDYVPAECEVAHTSLPVRPSKFGITIDLALGPGAAGGSQVKISEAGRRALSQRRDYF